jgi:hypothetical protein
LIGNICVFLQYQRVVIDGVLDNKHNVDVNFLGLPFV